MNIFNLMEISSTKLALSTYDQLLFFPEHVVSSTSTCIRVMQLRIMQSVPDDRLRIMQSVPDDRLRIMQSVPH